MADVRKKLSTNADGNFFVDATCINCDTCRQLAPLSFEERGDYSAVARQPAGDSELHQAYQALLACPVGSIGRQFGATRIIHHADADAAPGAEWIVEGEEAVAVSEQFRIRKAARVALRMALTGTRRPHPPSGRRDDRAPGASGDTPSRRPVRRFADVPKGAPEVLLMATEREVSLCVDAYERLRQEGISGGGGQSEGRKRVNEFGEFLRDDLSGA